MEIIMWRLGDTAGDKSHGRILYSDCKYSYIRKKSIGMIVNCQRIEEHQARSKQVIKSWRRYRRRGSSRKVNSIRPRELHRNISINIRQPRHGPRPWPTIALMLTLSSTRQPLKQQNPRRVRDVTADTGSNADGSGVAGPRTPRVSW
jgi:hypothetical protein